MFSIISTANKLQIMTNSDSDDFTPQVRVSKLSRKKKVKNKENGKAHTSTQITDLDGFGEATCT